MFYWPRKNAFSLMWQAVKKVHAVAELICAAEFADDC